MPFIANTDEQRKQMLAEMGLTMEGLFADIPPSLRCRDLKLRRGLGEQEVREHLADLAGKNSIHLTGFLGGGFYDHFIPAAVYALTGRSEFYTAYTPYQPEISQGTLQALFEYQSMICRLTEMEVSNASLYDGGTALYEAMMMALAATNRKKILIDDSVNPIYRVMIHSYTRNLKIELVETANDDGLANRQAILQQLDDSTAAVIVQNPNFFGCIDDFTDLAAAAHAKGALVICSVYPIALGILKTPGEMGVDIATGEGQSMGLPMSFGGPYLGFIAAKKDLVRRMPGRIVGQTTDAQGRRGFVLTLQAREQHIRREKATSNICSNQALCAIMAHFYMSCLGRAGLKRAGELCVSKADLLRRKLKGAKGVRAVPEYPVFHEFVYETEKPAAEVLSALLKAGLLGGLDLGRYDAARDHQVLVCVTEKRTEDEIERYVKALSDQ